MYLGSRKTFPVLVLFLIALALFMTFVASLGLSKSQSQKPSDADEHKKLVEAIRRGGYREAAKLKGHYVGSVDPNWDWANFDLETLTKNSVAIVVGVPEHSKGLLSAGGDMLTTDYDVRVQDIIKGADLVNGILATSPFVRVSLPGGKVEFEDGTSAEVQTPGFEPMLIGREYVLFLYANRNGSSVLLLTGGPQGLFELQPTGKVKAHGRPTDAAVKDSENKDVKSFVDEVRVFAHRWPQARGCCSQL